MSLVLTDPRMETVDVYFGLGTNLGDRKANLQKALAFLDESFETHYSALSGLHETEPWGFESQDRFMNAAVKYTLPVPRGTSRQEFARHILYVCYHSRIIDIDILLIGDWHVNETDLKIPHPLMRERDFVMVPLSEILQE